MYFILALSLLIFIFGLHAKLSLYQPAAPVHSVWLNGQKMDVMSSIEGASAVLQGLLTVVLFLFSMIRALRPVGKAYLAPTPFAIDPFQLFRFFRPPPVL
jgi:cellobiose-specific phosphotransferase system component IIC